MTVNGGHLILPKNSLAVFIDETGHEDLPHGHSVYGLGGCAVQEQDLERLLREPWKKIRLALNGSEDLPLHAANISRNLSKEHKSLIGNFFSEGRFMRVAVAVTIATRMPERAKRLEFVAPCLTNRILNVFKWTDAGEIALIFESSERADPLIERIFSSVTIGEGSNTVPFKGYFMPKSAGDPALEVADFIMHAVHGMAYDELDKGSGYKRKDFKSVFQTTDKKLSDFLLIEKIEINPLITSPA